MKTISKYALTIAIAASGIVYGTLRDPLGDLLDGALVLTNTDLEGRPFEKTSVESKSSSATLGTLVQQPPRAGQSRMTSASSSIGVHERMHYTVLRAFREAVGPSWQSTFRVLGDGHQVALGTVVREDGLGITKASELPENEIECRLPDGSKVAAKVIAKRSDLDLALLQLNAKGLRPIEWAESDRLSIGSWIATTDFKEMPLAIGVISVEPRTIRAEKPVLGISFEASEGGVLVKTVLPGSGANRAGIREGDILITVNGEPLPSRQALLDKIASLKAGQDITIELKRDDKLKTVRAELMDLNHALLDPTEMEVNGSVSARSTGFGSVFQHDTVLNPNHCGGPVIDLHGKAIGINIARAGRVSSYALPVSVLRPAIQEMLATASSGPVAVKENAIIRAQDTQSRNLVK